MNNQEQKDFKNYDLITLLLATGIILFTMTFINEKKENVSDCELGVKNSCDTLESNKFDSKKYDSLVF